MSHLSDLASILEALDPVERHATMAYLTAKFVHPIKPLKDLKDVSEKPLKGFKDVSDDHPKGGQKDKRGSKNSKDFGTKLDVGKTDAPPRKTVEQFNLNRSDKFQDVFDKVKPFFVFLPRVDRPIGSHKPSLLRAAVQKRLNRKRHDLGASLKEFLNHSDDGDLNFKYALIVLNHLQSFRLALKDAVPFRDESKPSELVRLQTDPFPKEWDEPNTSQLISHFLEIMIDSENIIEQDGFFTEINRKYSMGIIVTSQDEESSSNTDNQKLDLDLDKVEKTREPLLAPGSTQNLMNTSFSGSELL
jgi:hypothetical protein